MMKRWMGVLSAAMVLMALALAGCGGGGGGGSSSSDSGSTTTYNVSGVVTVGGTGLAGVTVSTSGGSATTNASGQYTISGLANGAYTLTPVKSGYTFTPATLAVTVNNANVTGRNFTAATTGGGEPWTSYFPTSVGSTWTFKEPDYSTLTTNRITSNTNNLVLMEETYSDATIDQNQIYTYSVGSNLKMILESQYHLSGTPQVSFTYSPGQVLIPSSTQIGTTETSTYTISDTQGSSDEVYTETLTVAAVESVTVPAGTFANALKINFTSSDGTSTYYGTMWFAPGVGPVRSIATNANRTIVTWEDNLQSYNIVH